MQNIDHLKYETLTLLRYYAVELNHENLHQQLLKKFKFDYIIIGQINKKEGFAYNVLLVSEYEPVTQIFIKDLNGKWIKPDQIIHRRKFEKDTFFPAQLFFYETDLYYTNIKISTFMEWKIFVYKLLYQMKNVFKTEKRKL
jgi:hypothetical protein